MSGSAHIPKGFGTVTPYLSVTGADGFLAFITDVFGAEEVLVTRGEDGNIRHASARIGTSMIEFSESAKEWGPMPAALHIYVEDTDAVYRRALDGGATSLYEPVDHYYGERSGGVADPHGINWYIATFIEEVSNDELARREAAMKVAAGEAS
jgi:PhnB protein